VGYGTTCRWVTWVSLYTPNIYKEHGLSSKCGKQTHRRHKMEKWTNITPHAPKGLGGDEKPLIEADSQVVREGGGKKGQKVLTMTGSSCMLIFA